MRLDESPFGIMEETAVVDVDGVGFTVRVRYTLPEFREALDANSGDRADFAFVEGWTVEDAEFDPAYLSVRQANALLKGWLDAVGVDRSPLATPPSSSPGAGGDTGPTEPMT